MTNIITYQINGNKSISNCPHITKPMTLMNERVNGWAWACEPAWVNKLGILDHIPCHIMEYY
jgi:hypothetical protein